MIIHSQCRQVSLKVASARSILKTNIYTLVCINHRKNTSNLIPECCTKSYIGVSCYFHAANASRHDHFQMSILHWITRFSKHHRGEGSWLLKILQSGLCRRVVSAQMYIMIQWPLWEDHTVWKDHFPISKLYWITCKLNLSGMTTCLERPLFPRHLGWSFQTDCSVI